MQKLLLDLLCRGSFETRKVDVEFEKNGMDSKRTFIFGKSWRKTDVHGHLLLSLSWSHFLSF